MTKNTIISHAHRHNWDQRRDARSGPAPTVFDRLADLHEEFNRKTGKRPGTGYVRGPGAPLR